MEDFHTLNVYKSENDQHSMEVEPLLHHTTGISVVGNLQARDIQSTVYQTTNYLNVINKKLVKCTVFISSLTLVLSLISGIFYAITGEHGGGTPDGGGN